MPLHPVRCQSKCSGGPTERTTAIPPVRIAVLIQATKKQETTKPKKQPDQPKIVTRHVAVGASVHNEKYRNQKDRTLRKAKPVLTSLAHPSKILL